MAYSAAKRARLKGQMEEYVWQEDPARVIGGLIDMVIDAQEELDERRVQDSQYVLMDIHELRQAFNDERGEDEDELTLADVAEIMESRRPSDDTTGTVLDAG